MSTDITRESVRSDQDAAELRDAMVDEVLADREWVGVVPREVEAALRTVPRHLFTPEVPLDQAYADRSIVTKRTEHGAPLSSVSAPHVQAMMLGQLQVASGQRVLEIGSGGYNAALLRELVRPEGSVTTLDIDQEIADRAHACLTNAGYRDVRVVCADGEFGAPEYGPFDRIIVTAGTWDIPSAWVAQLAEGGRLVIPLRTKGLNLSWALEHSNGHLAGGDPMPCGFVPMQGVGKNQSRSISLHGGEISLWVGEQQVDVAGLSEVFSTPRAQAWSDVRVRRQENFNDLGLWLARLPDFCLLSVNQDAVAGVPDLAHGHSGAAGPRRQPHLPRQTPATGHRGNDARARCLRPRPGRRRRRGPVRRTDPHLGPAPPPRPRAAPDGPPRRHGPSNRTLDRRTTHQDRDLLAGPHRLATHTHDKTESPMDAITPSTTDDELDLDVRFVESDLEFAEGDSGDCTDDNCKDTRGCE